MYLHVNMRHAKCLRVGDAGSNAEFYWTYQVFTEHRDNTYLNQGFSLGCPIGGAYSYSPGDQRELNDPRFTVKLPDLNEGETRHFYIDLHCWESDHSTEEVKKVFTNTASERLFAYYLENEKNKKKTQEEFMKWLENEDNDLLTKIIDADPIILPYVKIARSAIPLIKWAVELVKSNSDDYIGISRSSLIYTKKDGHYQYRWMFNNGVETWIDEEEAPIYHEHRFQEASGNNEILAKLIYQLVFDESTTLVSTSPSLIA
jgi:hypothetical protein